MVCASCRTVNEADAKFCKECGAPLAAAPASREQRKTVSVVFCDLAGSTALGEATDPEALRALLARYFEAMKAIVERHGGTVEKFIGDAVMAVFGVPVVHEDDALRACRAAVEMRNALPGLGMRGRIGVNTGEVVTGTAERLATGDAVNVAARLEQVAEPGTVLIGAETRRLLREAGEVGPARELEVKGKAQPLVAYPLLAVSHEGPARRLDVPIVGRESERRLLQDAWRRAVAESSCHLFTLLGSAGIGKSRLAADFLGSIDGARVAVGRCQSYGEGVTYSAAVEIASQLERPADERAAAAIASLLGESDEVFTPDELAWAFRRTVEAAAPAVVVFDDIHWAEPTLLDLIDHLADWSRGTTILVLCLARPELLERRPTWGGGKLNATAVLLEPLGAAETSELIDRLADGVHLDEALRARITEAAGGNALYVEEMLAMLADAPGSEVTMPPTIQALLAARLDQLDTGEREVLERGAVEGEVFHRGGVEALSDGRPGDARAGLLALVRKELVRPEAAQIPGDDAFRFRHLLIRDAAYEALSKSTRAELHERFVGWLDAHADSILEHDEISGYHLEQAHRYRVELALLDERTDELAVLAAQRLGAAAERAFVRRDMPSAARLLGRAVQLAPRRFLEHELALIDARLESDQPGEALALADKLIAEARADGDRLRELRVWMVRGRGTMLFENAGVEETRELALEAIERFDRTGDDAGLASAWLALGLTDHFHGRFGASSSSLQRSREYAQRAGGFQRADSTALWLASHRAIGPIPADEAERWFDENAPRAAAVPALLTFHAIVEAMAGHFDEARRLLDEGIGRSRELGQTLAAAASAMHVAHVELLAGDPQTAADAALAGSRVLEAAGEKGWRSTVLCLAAEALHRLGRDDEAWRQTELAEQLGAADDVMTQQFVRSTRARILAVRGDLEDAEHYAREAVEIADTTDALAFVADAHEALAEVLRAAGRADEAAAELRTAEELYERKGHRVGLARLREVRSS